MDMQDDLGSKEKECRETPTYHVPDATKRVCTNAPAALIQRSSSVEPESVIPRGNCQNMQEIEVEQQNMEPQDREIDFPHPGGVPLGDHPWDERSQWSDGDVNNILAIDLGYESNEATRTEKEENQAVLSHVSYFPSHATSLEDWDVREMGAWHAVADGLRDEATGKRDSCDFDGWLQARYRHDAARHIIGRLMEDVWFLRRGTERELWILPGKPDKIEPFGDLNWLPQAKISDQENALWEEYSELLDGLNILRVNGASVMVMQVLETKIDQVCKEINHYLVLATKEVDMIVLQREEKYALLMEKDRKEEDEENRANEERVARMEGQQPAKRIRREDGLDPVDVLLKRLEQEENEHFARQEDKPFNIYA